MSEPTALDLLAHQWRIAKDEETLAIQERIDIENQIIALIGAKEEGTTTHKTEWFKVTTTGRLTRTLNVQQLEEILQFLPDELADQLIRWKPEINLTALKQLSANDPEVYRNFACCVSTKPAKTGVTVELINE